MKKITKIFKNKNTLSKNLASKILKQIQKKKKFILGCPSGRTPTLTYEYMGLLSYKNKISLSKLKIIMMDEFVIKNNKNIFQLCNDKSHYSCKNYAIKTLLRKINYRKNKNHKLLKKNIYFPSIDDSKKYDEYIKSLGGIDLFILASGASDGHVAFNSNNAKLSSSTRIVKLKNSTRKDNLKTFSKFNSLKEVPKYGITVGLKTIFSLSKEAVLILIGEEKQLAAKIILSKKNYTKTWPATIIYKCKKKSIYLDKKAYSFK